MGRSQAVPLLLALALPAAPAAAQFAAERVAVGFTAPLHATAPPGDPRLFVVEQGGRIRILDGGAVRPTPFLDLGAAVAAGGERGLLGLAFAPDYASSGLFYVNYTRAGDGATLVARYRVSADPNLADPASAEALLTVAQPFSNHNGGHLAFGPDGFLYVALGDGGSGGDPLNHAQNTATALGSMLRIDVSLAPGYAVPPTNPGFPVPEIWSYGLRNPYRFSFDRLTGDLWIGDVGQSAVEEVNLQPAGSPGGENYGWRCYEGSQPFNTTGCPPAGSLVFPVLEYGHGDFPSVAAVVGGVRYRGPQPGLEGTYFFADFGGPLFAAEETAPGVFAMRQILVAPDAGSIGNVAGFGEDAAGELYLVDYDGELFRLLGAPPEVSLCPASPRPACTAPGRALLQIKDQDADGPGPRDRVVWKWLLGAAAAQADFGDPRADSDYALCVYAEGRSGPLLELQVPAGGAWQPLTRGFSYLDRSLASDGVFRLVLRGSQVDRSRIVLLGREGNLRLPALPLPGGGDVVAQLVRDDGPGCFETRFPPASVRASSDRIFKARIP